MKGDFTRKTFDPSRHYSRVMMQQGRVQLDADHNEQTAILLHYLRSLTVDLGGPAWGPTDQSGFFLSLNTAGNLTIGGGRYYVEGILCENEVEEGLDYLKQEGFNVNDKRFKDIILKPDRGPTYLAYLDVWERHITHLQDDRLREVALGGADTCTRAKVIWQVRLLTGGETPALIEKKRKLNQEIKNLKEQVKIVDADMKKKLQHDIDKRSKQLAALALTQTFPMDHRGLKSWLDDHFTRSKPMMMAQLLPVPGTTDPCSISPESRYRGLENQLYRIEVHRTGTAWNGEVGSNGVPAGNAEWAATFKWSRDNGSIVFPIVRQNGAVVTLQSLGRDERTGLKVGDWVEIMDDDLELQGQPGTMAQVESVDPIEMTVTLMNPDCASDSGNNHWMPYDENSTSHPLLRRWDQKAVGSVKLSGGAVLISESHAKTGWIEIEYGIEVQFQPDTGNTRKYQTGDYWLIPARVATGDIEWPHDIDRGGNVRPKAEPPFGIIHHYAPLGIIQDDGYGQIVIDRRCLHDPPPCVSTAS